VKILLLIFAELMKQQPRFNTIIFLLSGGQERPFGPTACFFLQSKGH